MPFYIADYLADTQHLSTEEHGAYVLLLMAAWMRGGMLPADDGQLMRICRCDKQAWKRVKPVLTEFFDITPESWTQPRLLGEYEHAMKVNESQRINGKKGGRPAKNKTQPQTQQKPTGFDSDNPNHNPNETPTQTQSPTPTPTVMDTSTEQSNVADSVCTTPGLACKAMREVGIPDGNPTHPTLIALVSAGAEIGEFQHAARQAIEKGKASFSYAIGIVKRQREEAAKLNLHQGRMPNKQEAIESRNREVASQWRPPEMEAQSANA